MCRFTPRAASPAIDNYELPIVAGKPRKPQEKEEKSWRKAGENPKKT
jgi:hypothetical protein